MNNPNPAVTGQRRRVPAKGDGRGHVVCFDRVAQCAKGPNCKPAGLADPCVSAQHTRDDDWAGLKRLSPSGLPSAMPLQRKGQLPEGLRGLT